MPRVLASAALWGLFVTWGIQSRAYEPASDDPPPVETAKGESSSTDSAAEPAEEVVTIPRPTRPGVGTIDLTRTFARHTRFHLRCAELRAKVAEAEAELKVGNDRLEVMAHELATAKPGDQKTLREKISLEQAQLKASVETRKAEFVRVETGIYRDAFADILRVVALHAEARGMRLVLRFDAAKAETVDSPSAIVEAMNQVILHQEGIDLTDAVIATVNGEPAADVVAPPLPPAPLADESPAAVYPVATLDLARVYAEDLAFKQLNDEMKRDVERAEIELKSIREKLVRESDKLGELEKGSEAYVEKDAAIRRGSAVVQSQVDQRKQQFALQEAKNYFHVLQGVRDEMRRLADSKGFTLVLRTSDTSKLSYDPKELAAELNRTIVYQRGIDVTNDVIAARNVKHAQRKE